MQFVANFTDESADPGRWAADREAEGFDVIACSDHFWTSRPYPHLWVTMTEQALATERVRITPCFANNLFRSPVEFAQASMSLQRASGGRFEAGLGAGWARDEITGVGLPFPDGRARARRYHEAMQIVRELMHTGSCRFEGAHYTVDVPMFGPMVDPPPLVASVGGPWVIRHVTPLADRVELNLSAPATRDGEMDLERLAVVDIDEVKRMVGAVREIAPDVPIGGFVLTAVGDNARVERMQAALGDSLFGGYFGEAQRVAANMHALEDLGFDRLQLTELAPGSIEELTPYLVGS